MMKKVLSILIFTVAAAMALLEASPSSAVTAASAPDRPRSSKPAASQLPAPDAKTVQAVRADGAHRPRRPARRSRLEDRARRDRLHPERSPGRRARHRADRRLGRLRRQRPLRRRLLPRLRPGEDPQAPRPPRHQTDSDWFMVAVDPYFDKRSGYAFGVNPAGSITDAALSNDVNDDDSWDGVWESKAAVNGEGWTVEMRIPFNQIRFPKKDEYVWGVNFRRMIQRKNEQSTFTWIPKSEIGLRLAVRPARGPARHQPGRPRRVHALRRQPGPVPPGRGGQSLRDRASRPGQRRLRPQGRPEEQPDPRRDGQSRLRPGRGRPGRPQPLGLRDLLRGEAALLHRGRVALQQFRPRRRLPQRQHQLAAADLLLQPAHRPGAAGLRHRGRVRADARPDDDPGRGQAHRASSAAAGTSASSTP